ncbi:MAG: succinylglutamate desuccinylase/aspartoacylase family protein [Patescibacteria group bacterium]
MKTPKSQKIKHKFIKIPADSQGLTLLRAESGIKDPTIWLTGGIHGDEVGGVEVVYEIFKKLEKSPLKRGAVFAFPLINQYGFKTGSKFFSAKKENLNCLFPGNPRGTAAEKAADKIFTAILKTKPTLVLDLHNDWTRSRPTWRGSIPYALIDPKIKNRNVYKLAHQTGLLVIEDEKNEVSKKSLSGSLNEKGIPAITLELSDTHQEKNVKIGVDVVWNILSSLEMTNAKKNKFIYPELKKFKGKIFKYRNLSTNYKTGTAKFIAKPGQVVKKNEAVAQIYNTSGKFIKTINTPANGVILGNYDLTFTAIRPRKPLVAMGVVK